MSVDSELGILNVVGDMLRNGEVWPFRAYGQRMKKCRLPEAAELKLGAPESGIYPGDFS